MDSNNTINTTVFNRWAYLITLMAIMLGGTGLFLFIGLQLEIPVIGIAAVLTFIVAPLIFLKKILALFEKQAAFIFEDNFFRLILSKKGNGEEDINESYDYSSISFCIVYTTKTGQYSTITFAFLNGDKQSYTLKSENGAPVNLSEVIYENIKLRHSAISLEPPLLASKTGLTILRGWVLIILLLIIVHFFVSIDTLPFSLIVSLAILSQIFVRRSSDIKSYEKLVNKKLE